MTTQTDIQVMRGPMRVKHSHVWKRDPHDFYVEPHWCSARLFAIEDFSGGIWDPACGTGRIVQSAHRACIGGVGSDIVFRGMGPELDFFDAKADCVIFDHIVSNPPYGIAARFVTHALTLARGKVAMLLPAVWLSGDKRSRWLEDTPLARVLFLTPRPSMPPGDEVIAGLKPSNGTADYAWLIWAHAHDGPPTLGWLRRDE